MKLLERMWLTSKKKLTDDTLMYSMNRKLIVFDESRCSEPNTTIHSRIPLIECASGTRE